MAFDGALTFSYLASPHRVAHSKTRLSLRNVSSYNGGPKLLSWPGNRIVDGNVKTMRSVRTFAELDGENVPDCGNKGNNEKSAVKEADRYTELLNMTEIITERIQKAQRMLLVESWRAQKELRFELYDGYSKDQLVKITITGLQHPVAVEIAEAAMEVGAEKLSVLVSEAYKDAFQKSRESLKNKLRNLDACLGMPGMPERARDQGVL